MPALSPFDVRPPPASEASLVRAIGVRQLTAAIVNTTVGAGIFVLPALVAQGLGAAAPLGFLACAALMALIAITLATAGSRVSVTGGIYAYVEAAFGPYLGLLAGVLQWMTGLVAVASVSVAMLDQISTFAPALNTSAARVVLLALVLGTLAALNARGVRIGTRLIETVTLAKLTPLILFVAIGAFFVEAEAFTLAELPGMDALGRAVLLLVFAYSGAETALAPSGEVRQPARTVPRALFLALGITTTLYISIQLVAQGTSGAALVQDTNAPLASAAARFLGSAGMTLMLAGAVCSMFGYLCGDMLSTPRSFYALARDGFLPAFLARIDPRSGTPRTAIWVHAGIVLLLASTNTFLVLITISNVGTLLLYLLCCGAAMALTRRDVRAGGEPFRMPGGSLAPILAAVIVVWVLSTATPREFAVTGGVLAAATLAYFARNRAQSMRHHT